MFKPAASSLGVERRSLLPRIDVRSLLSPLLVLLVPIGVHWPDLSGRYSSNPLFLVAGIATRRANPILNGQPGWIDWHAGATRQSLGSLAAWDWLHGVIPWWNPYVGVGMPLASQVQSSAFFLPFVLLEHFFDGTAYLKLAMQVIAGQATYRLLRHLGLRRTGSVTGAVLYELNGTFAWFGDAPMLPIAFLPLLILGVEQARSTALKHRGGGWVLVTIGIAYSLLAGFPETAYLGGLLALSWAVLRVFAAPRHRFAFALKVATGGVAGLLIASPLLFGFAEYLANAWPEPRGMAHAALLGPNFAMYIFPYLFGPILYRQQNDIWFHMGGYVGLCPFLLSVAALVGSPRERSLKWTLAGWIALACAKSAAIPGITDAFNLLPGMEQVMAFRYLAPTISFATSVLSAFAIDDILAGHRRRLRLASCLSLAITALAVTAALRWSNGLVSALWAYPAYRLWPVWSVMAAALLAILLGGLLSRRSLRAATLAAAVTATEAAILFVIPLLSGAPQRQIDRAPVDFLQSHLGLQRFYSVGPIGPNYGSYFRIAQINHNYLPLAQAWSDYVHENLDPGITPNVFNGTHPDLPARMHELSTRLAAYEGAGVKYVVAYNATNPFADLTSPLPFKAFSDALVTIYELPRPAAYFSTVAGLCTLKDEGRQRVLATCSASDTLVRRELLYPGWTATVNKKPTPLQASGQIFQSLKLPAGQATVQFRYAPTHVGYAYLACLAGVAVLLMSFTSLFRPAGGGREPDVSHDRRACV